MLYIRWILTMIGIALISSACSSQPVAINTPEGQENLGEEIPMIDSGEQTTSPTAEIFSELTQIPTENGTIAECEDPFKGSSPRFNTGNWKTNFCLHSIDYDEILSGGPPRDVIPPIDNPKFESVAAADSWLEDREPVIEFSLGEDVRAYPLQIMTWHEIVNDKVNNMPVLITFCPLCNTALVFERPQVDSETLTFGTSGNLRNSDLVMWDRQTESWWQQFSGEAIVGELTGNKLSFIQSTVVAWGDFKEKYPDAQVLSLDTGYNRDYGRNPYPGYDDVNSSPFLFDGIRDDRLRPMDRIIGILLESGQGKAFTLLDLKEKQVLHDKVGELPIAIFWKSGTASALDSNKIVDGADIGSVGVYQAILDGNMLNFTANSDGTFSDDSSGSTWDIFGQAIDGPLSGQSLQPVNHHETFWFAWAAFVSPDTLVNP